MSVNNRDMVKGHLAEEEKVVSRRDVLKKYGAYSAPAVIALFLPQRTVAMFQGTTYSSIAECDAAHGGMMSSHCSMEHIIG